MGVLNCITGEWVRIELAGLHRFRHHHSGQNSHSTHKVLSALRFPNLLPHCKICAGCTLINIGILVPSSLINLTEWLGGFWISFFAIKDLLCERCEMKKYKWHFWNIARSFFIYNFQSRAVKIRTWEYYTTLRGNFYYVPETCWLFSFQVSYYYVISI